MNTPHQKMTWRRRLLGIFVLASLVVSITTVAPMQVTAVTVGGTTYACPDMTGDGLVDASDVSAYAAAAGATPQSMTGDFTGDSTVDNDDQLILAAWLGHSVNCQTNTWTPWTGNGGYCAAACPDMNQDGNIDASDLSAFAAARAANTLSTADFNGDGVIDNRDEVYIQILLGTTNFVCCLPQTSDVTITKTDGKTTAVPGEATTYTITITNTATVPATGVQVTDALPSNYGTITALTDNGTWNGSTTIVWDNLTVPAQGSKVLTYNGLVSSSMSVGLATVLTNTATLGCSAGACPFVGTAIDTTTVNALPTTVSSQSSLTVQKIVTSGTTAFAGGTTDYSVQVTNTSTTTALVNVVLQDTLPAGFTFESDGSTARQFVIGSLLPGASSTVSYTALISTATTPANYTNTVVATADNAPSVTATAGVTVQGPLVLGETADNTVDGDPASVKVLAETGPAVVDFAIFAMAAACVAAGYVTLRRVQVRR